MTAPGYTFSSTPRAQQGGSCYQCEHFGREVGKDTVWCEREKPGHITARASRGCVFWMRAIGADDEERPAE